MILRSFFAATATALLLGVTGCGDSSEDAELDAPEETSESAPAPGEPTDTAPTDDPPAAEPEAIVIKDFKFTGAESVPPGATIEVRNDDRSSHTVTSDDGEFEEVIVEGNGATGTFTAPAEPGTYDYVCTFHPEMEGTLVVE